MVETKEVNTTIGVFELIRPKAGVRNRAMIKAERNSGGISRVIFMTEILPKIINKRPEGCDKDVPITQILDSLDIDDYDLLVEAADALIESSSDKKDEIEKKTSSSTISTTT